MKLFNDGWQFAKDRAVNFVPVDGVVADTEETRFGFRTVDFTTDAG